QQQIVRRPGLAQEGKRRVEPGAASAVRIRVAAREQEAHRPPFAAQGVVQRSPTEARHYEVGEDEVDGRPSLPQHLERLLPVRRPAGLAVKNGSTILRRVSSSIPTPVSPTYRQTYSPGAGAPQASCRSSVSVARAVSMRRTPPFGMASRALVARLKRICSVACTSARASGRPVLPAITTSTSAGSVRRRN